MHKAVQNACLGVQHYFCIYKKLPELHLLLHSRRGLRAVEGFTCQPVAITIDAAPASHTFFVKVAFHFAAAACPPAHNGNTKVPWPAGGFVCRWASGGGRAGLESVAHDACLPPLMTCPCIVTYSDGTEPLPQTWSAGTHTHQNIKLQTLAIWNWLQVHVRVRGQALPSSACSFANACNIRASLVPTCMFPTCFEQITHESDP
jgi:hypothetical protein